MPNNLKNAMDLMALIRSGNPQELTMNMLRTSAQGNPVMQNLLALAEQGNTRDIEAIVRNIAKERGIDYDKEFNSFKQMFRL